MWHNKNYLYDIDISGSNYTNYSHLDKQPVSQLSLFENNWQNKANELLQSLNDGRKGKEVFNAGNAAKIANVIIISAHNSKGNSYYNTLDESGRFPDGLSACWRSFQYIQHEVLTPSLNKERL